MDGGGTQLEKDTKQPKKDQMTTSNEVFPPFYVVPMPINAEGHGPEMDKSKVVRTQYEVWDQINTSYDSFGTEEEAENRARMLNRLHGCPHA